MQIAALVQVSCEGWVCLGSCRGGAPLWWQNKMIIVKCVVFYMLCAGIYTCVHGDKRDLLFHLCGGKHRGGGPGYQSIEGTMLFVCQAAPEKWHSHFLSNQRGFLLLFLLILSSLQNKTDCRNLQVFWIFTKYLYWGFCCSFSNSC